MGNQFIRIFMSFIMSIVMVVLGATFKVSSDVSQTSNDLFTTYSIEIRAGETKKASVNALYPSNMIKLTDVPTISAGGDEDHVLKSSALSAGADRFIDYGWLNFDHILHPVPKEKPSVKNEASPKKQEKSVSKKESTSEKEECNDKKQSVDVSSVQAVTPGNGCSYEEASLAALIHFEAGTHASLESKCVVGNVVSNRVNDVGKWGYANYESAIYAPGQFTVVKKGKFVTLRDELMHGESTDPHVINSLTAARAVMGGQQFIPADVEFFHGNENKRSWGTHTYWSSIGGNAYFIK